MTRTHSATTAYVVTDRYDVDNPLKGSMSTGSQIEVSMSAELPLEFQTDFLRNRKNKDNMYNLIVPALFDLSQRESLDFTITHREAVLGRDMPPSNHVEADYRMVLFVLRAIQDGHKKIVIRTGDTDVVVIMIGHMERFISLCPCL